MNTLSTNSISLFKNGNKKYSLELEMEKNKSLNFLNRESWDVSKSTTKLLK